MNIVYVISLLNALNFSSGQLTGPDGKTVTFPTRAACITALHTKGLDHFELTGPHGRCEPMQVLAGGQLKPIKRHRPH